jgi:hypothetical protein
VHPLTLEVMAVLKYFDWKPEIHKRVLKLVEFLMSSVIKRSLKSWIPIIQYEFIENPKSSLVLINAIVKSQKKFAF